jgi:16S rRNA processing protein RimM
VTDKPLIAIGRIVGAHGITGNLKIRSYAESLSAFQAGATLLVKSDRGREKSYRIKWAQPHAKGILLAFERVDNRDQAEALVGSELWIAKSQLPELEEGTYYWSDLIGLSVFSKDEAYLGRIAAILPTGSNDVYVVENTDQGCRNEVLIPALESVVLDIDLEKRVMHVDLPEGL